jgi:uncharacterized protein (TIGR00730 family)
MVTINKTRNIEEALQSADEILTAECQDLRSSLYKDLILNALKCKRDDLDILDLKVISRALVEFRHAARAFKPYRQIRKVSMFGSARVTAENPAFKAAAGFGRLAAEAGFMVITGGADGIMRAGIEGAGAPNSFGVNILLPFEKDSNSLIRNDPKSINFKYFFIRKIFFVMEADAVAVFPGGFGTHDETFEVLTLLQTGKTAPIPVVLVESAGENYWEAWDFFIRSQMLTRRLLNKEDLSFYHIVNTPAEARNYIKFFYSTYHSLRQVRDRLVVRLEKELPDYRLKELNLKFADIVATGEIVKTNPLGEEFDEPDLLNKPRLCLAYNRKSAGRLNEMILTINRMGEEI